MMQGATMVVLFGHAMGLEGSPFGIAGLPNAGWATDMPGYDHGWSWAKKGSFGIQGKQRMYFMENIHANDWWGSKYVWFNLLGKTVTFTVDLSGIPCGVAACLYFVSYWNPGPDSKYCDIQPNFGGCFELDLMEANSHAYEASLHTEIGSGKNFDATCNMNGCSVNVGRYPFTRSGLKSTEIYGPGAKVINTNKPFQVKATVSKDGYMTIVLSQEGRILPHFNRTEAGNFPGVANQDAWKPEKYPTPGGISKVEAAKVVAAMKKGVRLVASTWTTADTSWLDGTACNDQPHGNIWDAKMGISNWKVQETPSAPADKTDAKEETTTAAANDIDVQLKFAKDQGAFAAMSKGITTPFSILLWASAMLAGFVMLRVMRGLTCGGNLTQLFSYSGHWTAYAPMADAGELLESAPISIDCNVGGEE
mmetsp:Transcript_56101/g.111492  ORF Transcript_56101/g.111492 Transcript_56101/m.111492 type:complete len:421 (+) Transcript_56101:44-1306(+)